MMIRHADRLRYIYTLLIFAWLSAALLFVLISGRPSGFVIVPMTGLLWFAARAELLRQNAQLVWPVLMLPGAVLCFVGFMQSMGYGHMQNEPDAQFEVARLAFFTLGLMLHFAGYVFFATEPRAADHVSGAMADKI